MANPEMSQNLIRSFFLHQIIFIGSRTSLLSCPCFWSMKERMSWNLILIAMKELTLALAPWGKKHPYPAPALQRNGINEIEIPLI